MNTTQATLDLLKPLFEDAIRNKKWFFSNYQGLYFSPRELKKAHAEGRFVWGPQNWRLVDPPSDYDIEKEVQRMKQHNEALAIRKRDAFNI